MNLQFCHRVCAPHSADQANGAIQVRKRGSVRTVDVHCHALVPEVERLVAGRPEKDAEQVRQVELVGAASVGHNNHVMLPAAAPKLTSLEQRLSDMDAMGIDVQVVSPVSVQHYYWANVDLAREIVRVTNEKLAELCARQPDRLVALGNVALQHPDLSVQ